MLLASLSPYDATSDSVGNGVYLRLGDDEIQNILSHLEKSDGRSLVITVGANNLAAGSNDTVSLKWSNALAGFACSVNDMQAGYLMLDELKGALGKELPKSYRPCRVCLSAEIDIWRSGLVDLMTGFVQVYTTCSGAAHLGAAAYLVDGNDTVCIMLASGDPSKEGLRVPSAQLRAMQRLDQKQDRLRDTYDIDVLLDRMGEMSNTFAAFKETMGFGSKAG